MVLSNNFQQHAGTHSVAYARTKSGIYPQKLLISPVEKSLSKPKTLLYRAHRLSA